MDVGLGSYTSDTEQLEDLVTDLLDSYPARQLKPEAIIVPHGNIITLGEIAAQTFKAARLGSFQNAIILTSVNHIDGPDCCYTTETFTTPLGSVDIDTTLATQLQLSDAFHEHSDAFTNRDNIHFPLLFLQHLFDDLKIFPIIVENSIDQEKATEIVKELQKHRKPEDLIIISSNLSHAEDMTANVKDLVQKHDSQLINHLREADYRSIQEHGSSYGIDAWQALSMGCELIGKKQLHTIKHMNSYDDDSIREAATGYGGFVYTD